MEHSIDNMGLAADFPFDELELKFTVTNCEELDRYKIKRFRFALSKKQRDDLLRTALENSTKDHFMIFTQLHTGMRVGEMANLRICDVALDEAIIYIQEHKKDEYCDAWAPKTASGIRMIPMDLDLVSSMRGYLRDEKRIRGYVFTTQRAPHYNPKSLNAKINTYALQTKGIGHKIGTHALRRTYASHLINEGVPIGVISRVLGHKSIQTTMKYLFQIESPENHEQIRVVMKTI